ncbi:ABC transporter permease [Falsirhodobacter sp. 20TX0035]|uniref:ABC transporter permease n=1 Tax=Falsirhodobacter sp. 20TX0035 TaxID=3022019 RepID=UPI00232EE0E0|nr:ABC transporter permease [Falsirhodobacter sp. 20TX0035]MDB6452918.1 ABC transporter permease [Falsirhodobacter sp. 20TX0035]
MIPNRLALVLAVPLAAGLALPFAGLRANRIAAAEPVWLWQALGAPAAIGIALLAVLTVMWGRVLAAPALAAWLALMGVVAHRLTAGGPDFARVSPGAGFWLGAVALALLLADALAQRRPGPVARLTWLAAAWAALALLLQGWGHVSILQEYAARYMTFWAEAQRHLALALGSFAGAVLVGVPLGVLIQRRAGWRGPVMGTLTAIQTVPSIALFGLLILPLGWLATHVPMARAVGIGGIGMAPAFVALFLYALLPIVTNTVAGLRGIPASVAEAARGMGLSPRQRLARVDIPLALPVILTGARIVLVQNIGLATIGALIGAGGFGTFVFQGLGQTAPDLILLGALPTVALAFSAQVVFDALIDLLPGARA